MTITITQYIIEVERELLDGKYFGHLFFLLNQPELIQSCLPTLGSRGSLVVGFLTLFGLMLFIGAICPGAKGPLEPSLCSGSYMDNIPAARGALTLLLVLATVLAVVTSNKHKHTYEIKYLNSQKSDTWSYLDNWKCHS